MLSNACISLYHGESDLYLLWTSHVSHEMSTISSFLSGWPRGGGRGPDLSFCNLLNVLPTTFFEISRILSKNLANPDLVLSSSFPLNKSSTGISELSSTYMGSKFSCLNVDRTNYRFIWALTIAANINTVFINFHFDIKGQPPIPRLDLPVESC